MPYAVFHDMTAVHRRAGMPAGSYRKSAAHRRVTPVPAIYRFITFNTAMLIACAAVLIDGSGTGA